MKVYANLMLATGVFLASVMPAHAQFGDLLKKAQEAIEEVVEEVAPAEDANPPAEEESPAQDNTVSADCPEPTPGYFPRCWRMQQEDVDAAEAAYRAKWEEEARVEREAEEERERQELAANQKLLSEVDANSDCAALFSNPSTFYSDCLNLRSEAQRQEREIAQKERKEKARMEEEARQQRFDDHIAGLTVIGQDEVLELLRSGLPVKLLASKVDWEISFFTELTGLRADAGYKFKGDMTCSDDWGDKVGNRTEVEGFVGFDDSGAIDFQINMTREPKAKTWVGVTLNQLDLGIKSTDVTKVQSCAFSGIKIRREA